MKKNNAETFNIIVVGAGKIGNALIEQLVAEGHDLTIVDTNDRAVQDITEAYDIMGVIGSGASMSILEEAGIASADMLIAVTGSDEMNMLCFADKQGIKISTMPIKAIYIDGNKSSHFNPVKDTVRIYKRLFSSLWPSFVSVGLMLVFFSFISVKVLTG